MSDSNILAILDDIDVDSIAEKQADQINKELVRAMLEDIYTDGVDDLTRNSLKSLCGIETWGW